MRYLDQNLIFVFDHSTRKLLTSDIFIKAATIGNEKCLRYGKNFDIDAFFTNLFLLIYLLMNVYTGYNLAVKDTIYFICNKIQ